MFTDVGHDVPCHCDIEGLPSQAEALIGYCIRMVLPQLRNLDVGIVLRTHKICADQHSSSGRLAAHCFGRWHSTCKYSVRGGGAEPC